jgi:hypothetical protein
MSRCPYVKVQVLELDYQLYWKMTSQKIPQIGYTEMIITCHNLEAHVRSFLVHCLLPVSLMSTTASCYFFKIRHLDICYYTYFKNICKSSFTWAAPQPCRYPKQWRRIRSWTIQTNTWWLEQWWRCHGRRSWIAQQKLIRWWWSHSATCARYYNDIYKSCYKSSLNKYVFT